LRAWLKTRWQCARARKGHHRFLLSHPMIMAMATALVTMMITLGRR
jgi:hypothetical protein